AQPERFESRSSFSRGHIRRERREVPVDFSFAEPGEQRAPQGRDGVPGSGVPMKAEEDPPAVRGHRCRGTSRPRWHSPHHVTFVADGSRKSIEKKVTEEPGNRPNTS